jgi:hypothetical protein
MVAEMIVVTSVSQFIPEARRERAIYLGQVSSDAAWEIGQLIALTIDELKQAEQEGRETGNVVEIGVMDVYKEFASLTGKATRTVREYVQIVDFYASNGVGGLDDFPGLSIDHLRSAMRNPARWREMLSACLVEAHNRGGIAPSVDWMEAKFGDVNTADGELLAFSEENRHLEGLRNIADEQDPEKRLRLVVSHLTGLIHSVQQTLALLPFDLPKVEKLLGDLVDELERLGQKTRV